MAHPYFNYEMSTTPEFESHTHKSDGHTAKRRLQQELMALMMNEDKSISAFPEDCNMYSWIGTVIGPSDTVYDGFSFKLKLEFSTSYPYTPPRVRFLTSCFHPNVDLRGHICLDILQDKWSASFDVRTILLSIQSLLGGNTNKKLYIKNAHDKYVEPNNESPLNPQAAMLWTDPEAYRQHLSLFNNETK